MFRSTFPYLIIIIILSLVLGAFWIYKKSALKPAYKFVFIGLLISISALLFNSFWIERHNIQLNSNILKSASISKKIALISDIHIGSWKDKNFVQSLSEKINLIPDLDLVLIAGDWTYYPDKSTLIDTFSPLKNLKVPVYGVLGNHDVEYPGDPIRKELSQALTQNNVNLIDNTILRLDNIDLVGLGDNWANEDDTKILDSLTLEVPVIILAHNPDSTLKYSKKFRNDVKESKSEVLTVSGHTHCGQVRIPPIYKRLLPVKDNFYEKAWYRDDGLDNTFFSQINDQDIPSRGNQLFISCGVGEVGLPLRLFNPATIDIIEWKK